MKTFIPFPRPLVPARLWTLLLLCSTVAFLTAATIYTEDFESYSGAALDLNDTSDANPASPDLTFPDDNPAGGVGGSGVQLISWLAVSGTQSLLLRSGSEAQVQLKRPLSGTRYQLDVRLYVSKGLGDRNFYLILRSMGADSNGEDHLAYRSDRGATPQTFYFDGIGPGAGAWVDPGPPHIENQWQHHRMIFDTAAQTFDLYVDDMMTPVVTGGDLSRSGGAVPTLLIIRHEGNSDDDGYFAIDDISWTVEGSQDLSESFTEGFESYAARVDEADDADPQGPWVTVEADGTATGSERAPTKIQVVDNSVVAPRSGAKCLKIEGGQRAGVSYAWGTAPQADVRISWWARVPGSVGGTVANYLRMSLYGLENDLSLQGDAALLGYGSRDDTIGDETSLTYFTTGWLDSGVDYEPDTWVQYQITTHTVQGTYTIVKNPNGASPQIIADRAPFIGSAATWGPMFMVAWSSSNGTGHPPVYIDDIQIRSLVSMPDPLPDPYTIALEGNRFSGATSLSVGGTVGGVAVDPRDNTTILFTLDAAGGGIYQARKVAAGNWAVDPTPIVTGLDRPSGVAVGADGTIWWTHDFTQSLQRLRTPWNSSSAEEVISNFGAEATDDDPIDVVIAPSTFMGTSGQPGSVVVADRGSDGNANNALYVVDPATMDLNQTTYTSYLVFPSATELGGGNINAITSLPQSGEVVTLTADAFITAVNGNGTYRYVFPTTLFANPLEPISPAAIAADPTTGRLWIADDILDEIWSVDPDAMSQTSDAREVRFPLTDEEMADKQIDFHDPGMVFSPDGAFLVVSDSSTVNGGGRLLIFHNETFSIPDFSITVVEQVPGGVHLEWQSAGAVKYRVLRGTDPADGAGFTDVSGDLTVTEFTDTDADPGQGFYLVLASQ